MALYEVFTLKAMWDFLNPLLTDKIKEKIKQKTSAERAKERAFHLYMTLGRVVELKSKVHSCLKECLLANNHFQDPILLGEIVINGEAMELTVDTYLDKIDFELEPLSKQLLSALEELSLAIDEVNPQLEIHKHELVKFIQNLHLGPVGLINLVRNMLVHKDLLSYRDYEDSKKIKEAIEQAVYELDKNYRLMSEAIEDFREFLAKEFSFKESF